MGVFLGLPGSSRFILHILVTQVKTSRFLITGKQTNSASEGDQIYNWVPSQSSQNLQQLAFA
ncbi:hypothetical protein SLY_1062 [Strawberry lethal yellows phytoplasma (CPA) str. NZSb11]|uniref:Uncharacterized protein n=3 Tax=Phytoplasma australiense TaxID=59748 RepID=R4RR50_PHYAS|nr:hypothetical protein SLY_1062 [Strawberry lethal yellows phytoplasma (CPA) str. NZSb11]